MRCRALKGFCGENKIGSAKWSACLSLESYKEEIIKLMPKSREKRARKILYVIYYTLKKFLLGISVSMTINGTLTFLDLEWADAVIFGTPTRFGLPTAQLKQFID